MLTTLRLAVIVFAASLAPVALLAQDDASAQPGEPVYETINTETPPEFPGGQQAMMTYMAKNLRYPAQAEVQGKVVVGFTVEPDGCLSNVRTVLGVGSALDREAVRMVSSMPAWTPGRSLDEPVRVNMALPIHVHPR